MEETRHLFIVFKKKLLIQEFRGNFIKLNKIQNDFEFCFDNKVIEEYYDSNSKQVSEKIEFFQIKIRDAKVIIDFSITYYADSNEFFGINQLKSEDSLLFREYEQKLLELFNEHLLNCLFVGHDNLTGIDIRQIYRDFSSGVNLDNMYIYYLK